MSESFVTPTDRLNGPSLVHVQFPNNSQQVLQILTTYRFAISDHYRSARLPPNVARFHQYLKCENAPLVHFMDAFHFVNAHCVINLNRNPTDEEYNSFNVLRQMPWSKQPSATLRIARENPATRKTHTSTKRAPQCIVQEARNTLRSGKQNSCRLNRAPRRAAQLRPEEWYSSAAHLAVADGDPHGELGRSGAAGLLRHCGGGPGDPMPGRSPPRAAWARERGVERRRGEGDVVVVAVRERQRRRREEEVERGGGREHLEAVGDSSGGGQGGGAGWGEGRWAGKGRKEGGGSPLGRREGGDAPTNLITFSLSPACPPPPRPRVLASDCWGFGMQCNRSNLG